MHKHSQSLKTEYRKEEKLVSQNRNSDTKYKASSAYTVHNLESKKQHPIQSPESNINPPEGERVGIDRIGRTRETEYPEQKEVPKPENQNQIYKGKGRSAGSGQADRQTGSIPGIQIKSGWRVV